jgi:hypothetical protein
VAAPRTSFPIDAFLSQHNNHLKFHSWLHRARKLRRANDTIILSVYDLIVPLQDEVASDGILAITLDDIVEILGCDNVKIEREETK